MKQVAKLLIIDEDNKYLLLHRDNHPTFGTDPDLPGGTMEAGETLVETVIREVQEEIGVLLDSSAVAQVHSELEYKQGKAMHALFITQLRDTRPEITLSWEHALHEWLDRETFLQKAKNANDTYMHMVHSQLTDKVY